MFTKLYVGITLGACLALTMRGIISSKDSSHVYAYNLAQNSLHVGPTPIVLWHGFNSSINDTKELARFLKKQIPGVYVHSLMIGRNTLEDVEHSITMDANKQVKIACQIIKRDKRLRKGYTAIGLSQGGLFLRAVAQRCPNPPMRNLITLGTPHQGIYGVPRCPYETSILCDFLRKMLTSAAYDRAFQRHMTQAQFWHDPIKSSVYIAKSTFLADINNERELKNSEYKRNLQNLKNFVMVKYEKEDIVYPPISSWFGFFAPGQGKIAVELQNSTLYQEDWIGLRELEETGRLHFLESPGKHMNYDWTWLKTNIVDRFLKPKKSAR